MSIPKVTIPLIVCFVALATVPGCSPAHQPPAFDGNRAFQLLQDQVNFGPRVPGSPGHTKASLFISNELGQHADGKRFQEFTETIAGKKLAMRNIIGWFHPPKTSAGNTKEARWVLLAAHWDTRPIADYEITYERRNQPIPGANDGASGVAVLLELARMFRERKPSVGVLMVFFDGEDYGPGSDQMYLGSKHFAANLADSLTIGSKRVKVDYGILLDMVGDRNLGIYREKNSVDAAPEIVEKVWKAARELGYQDKFIDQVKYAIDDDHIQLIKAGIKCIDVIDFDYGPWHTLDDKPDKCSAESLKIVGDVIARVIYAEK
ncbi:MAG: M28 family peptidase [Armatimonadetes bacterium]|nr:M28 family peptidase [Armatimonadota bacterium]